MGERTFKLRREGDQVLLRFVDEEEEIPVRLVRPRPIAAPQGEISILDGEKREVLMLTSLDDLDEDVLVFHAGTRLAGERQVVTSGGRVLTVVADGETLMEARGKVYTNIPRIHFEGAQYRRDIAVIEGWS